VDTFFLTTHFSGTRIAIGVEVWSENQSRTSTQEDANSDNVTFSMGVVTFTRPPKDVEQALHVADTVMYNVKHAGRNRILYMTSTGEAA
jgi:PleD family two-component response regulator